MTEWVLAVEGTEAGRQIAVALALLAALLHATLGAMQKGRYDPVTMRGAVDACYVLLALPLAFFVVPWPEPALWPVLAGVFLVHSVYKLLQARAYERGALTVVYPVVRGTGPLVTVLVAGVLFSESYSAQQWGGVVLLSGSILALAWVNLREVQIDRDSLLAALGYAVATGCFVAIYTVYDAWGIRLAEHPAVFLVWFFIVDGVLFPVLAWRRRLLMSEPPALGPLMRRGFVGALVAMASFGSIMLATRVGKVGEAAVLRETSTVFAAVIGWWFLGERVGAVRAAIICLIAVGAVLVY
ncbi:MAG: DMT family transporter [Pseudomonadota bacterium]